MIWRTFSFADLTLAMGSILIAFGLGLGLVTVYYVAWSIAAVSVQKFFQYDNPQGLFYKIIDFPVSLPGFVFDLAGPAAVKRRHFNFKKGYLRRALLCFILNVVFYSVIVYFLLLNNR